MVLEFMGILRSVLGMGLDRPVVVMGLGAFLGMGAGMGPIMELGSLLGVGAVVGMGWPGMGWLRQTSLHLFRSLCT